MGSLHIQLELSIGKTTTKRLDIYNIGLSKTLAAFEEEAPRTNESITHRSQLISSLNFKDHMKQNKASSSPLKTVLEVLANNHVTLKPSSATQPRNNEQADITIEDEIESETMLGGGRAGVFQSETMIGNNMAEAQFGLQPKPTKTTSRSRGMAGPITSGLQKDSVHRQWKYGPALREDSSKSSQASTHSSPADTRASPPSQVNSPDDNPPERQRTANNGRRAKKKSSNGNIESDSVMDALGAIRNARKRQPGATFLAKNVLPPTSSDSGVNDFTYDIKESSISSGKSRSRIPADHTMSSAVNHNSKLLNGSQNPEESRGRRKSRDKKSPQKSSFSLLGDDDSADITNRTFKTPKSDFASPSSERDSTRNDSSLFSVDNHEQLQREDGQNENDITSGSSSSLSAHAPIPHGKARENTSDSIRKASPSKQSQFSHGFKQLTANQPTDDRNAMVIDDDVTEEVEDPSLTVEPTQPIHAAPPSLHIEATPIDLETAVNLKRLIFGLANKNFSDEWRYQSFCFCDLPGLQYGIVQKKGGSCGVLASVQACMLQQLLFSATGKPSHKLLQVTRKKRTDVLASALAHILWRAGNSKNAVVALPAHSPQFPLSSKFKGDKITERLILNRASKLDDLLRFIKMNISQFELDGSAGVILCLYSVILSRSINNVRSDMDDPKGTLMGAHGYCTQEMVNLLLTGRAVSNVFNDVMELDSGDGHVTVLKGISERADIGFLTLFEHYKSCQVGTYYKVPRWPIWIVCSESHFSVLFALNQDLLNNWRAERRFDLYYYDGLAGQDAEIKLTIDTSNPAYKAPPDDDLVPPLELCIRTKWPDAEIDWNGTEPIL